MWCLWFSVVCIGEVRCGMVSFVVVRCACGKIWCVAVRCGVVRYGVLS